MEHNNNHNNDIYHRLGHRELEPPPNIGSKGENAQERSPVIPNLFQMNSSDDIYASITVRGNNIWWDGGTAEISTRLKKKLVPLHL